MKKILFGVNNDDLEVLKVAPDIFWAGVTDIGTDAFEGLDVKELKIPEGIESIGQTAFYESKIRKVDLPSTLRSIGKHAFVGTQLKELVIPEGVDNIQEGAFVECPKLKKVTLPKSVRKVEKLAFAGNQLDKVTIANKDVKIDTTTFKYSLVEEFVIPEGADKLENFLKAIMPKAKITHTRIINEKANTENNPSDEDEKESE